MISFARVKLTFACPECGRTVEQLVSEKSGAQTFEHYACRTLLYLKHELLLGATVQCSRVEPGPAKSIMIPSRDTEEYED